MEKLIKLYMTNIIMVGVVLLYMICVKMMPEDNEVFVLFCTMYVAYKLIGISTILHYTKMGLIEIAPGMRYPSAMYVMFDLVLDFITIMLMGILVNPMTGILLFAFHTVNWYTNHYAITHSDN